MTEPEVQALLRRLHAAWSRDTATTWTPANPALGQCSVTALVVQDRLGGDILKARVGDAWHFYNCIDGERLDLTAEQFATPISYDDLPSSRAEAMTDTSPEQYAALVRALGDAPQAPAQ